MDIKELCRLCGKYDANKLSLKLKYSELKDRIESGWDINSLGIRQIEIELKKRGKKKEKKKIYKQELYLETKCSTCR